MKSKNYLIPVLMFFFVLFLAPSEPAQAAAISESHGVVAKATGGVVTKKGSYLCYVSSKGKTKKLESIKSMSTPYFCVSGSTVYYIRNNYLYSVRTNGTKKTRKAKLAFGSKLIGTWGSTVISRTSGGYIQTITGTKKVTIMEPPIRTASWVKDTHIEGNWLTVSYEFSISKPNAIYRYNLKTKKTVLEKGSTWLWSTDLRYKTDDYTYTVEKRGNTTQLIREDVLGREVVLDSCSGEDTIKIAGANNGKTVMYQIIHPYRNEKNVPMESFVLYRKTGTAKRVELMSTEDCKKIKYFQQGYEDIHPVSAFLYKNTFYVYLYHFEDHGFLYSVNKDGSGLKMIDGQRSGKSYSIWDVKQVGNKLYYAYAKSSEEQPQNYNRAAYKELKMK